MKMPYKKISVIILFQSPFLLFISCSLFNSDSHLHPEDKEFLSKARYIITPEEKKIFLEIPESENEKFKKEFWERRDPDPATEENEFKETYFKRVDEANKLFSTGKPGWTTDRGEIYILFGPPTNIDKYPMGHGPGTYPTETWYYGYFPIFFVDRYGTGDYVRSDYDVIHIHEINKALKEARKTLRYEVAFFDFSLKFETDKSRQLILVKIPYKNMWLKSTPKGEETVISLTLEAYDENDQIVWKFQKKIPVRLTEEELKEKMKKDFVVRIPLKLKNGTYRIQAVLINTTDEKESKKEIKIKI